jgi:beta-glucanase (GH16 family)
MPLKDLLNNLVKKSKPDETSVSSTKTSSNPPYWQADFSPSTPITANFTHEVGDWGWGNNELENYTDSPQNSYHTASNSLVIKAIVNSKGSENKYTSARLTSKQLLGRCRGYIEATISAPSAKGIWPAFWLLPCDPFKWPEDGEVDIMESWNGASDNHTCLHWGSYEPSELGKHRVAQTSVAGLKKPHVYGFAWEQPERGDGEGGRCVWYIDGRAVMKSQIPKGIRRFEEYRVILNVAIGGNVCNGAVPRDGTYELTVHDLRMCEAPDGGWEKFDDDWRRTREGKPL